VRDLTSRGVDRASARQNAGVHTITLRRGRLHDVMRALEPTGTPAEALDPCDGHYALRGQRYTFAWETTTNCTGDFTATWSLRRGVLRLSAISTEDPIDRVVWGLKPFRKIG
jgi:hypothetical protein